MTFKELIEFIAADLYRYNGQRGVKCFLQYFFFWCRFQIYNLVSDLQFLLVAQIPEVYCRLDCTLDL